MSREGSHEFLVLRDGGPGELRDRLRVLVEQQLGARRRPRRELGKRQRIDERHQLRIEEQLRQLRQLRQQQYFIGGDGLLLLVFVRWLHVIERVHLEQRILRKLLGILER
jgi:hypothetical protein